MNPDDPIVRRTPRAVFRRDFLRLGAGFAFFAASPWQSAAAPGARATATGFVPPARARGETRINVRDHGARGDGANDDTKAIQAAIDALPAAGGTVYVPSGRYLIDAPIGLRLRDRMHLEMATGTALIAKATAERKYRVLYASKVSDVEVSGGQILGDRTAHLGTTGEWGYGIHLRGASRVTVRDMRIADCWGDGVCIGGADHDQATPSEDIVLARIVSTSNRRQGLSIGRSLNVRVYDSEFSNTSGTKPQFGIDIEPDRPGGADNILIGNCVIRGNQGGGIQIFRRVTNITIRGCTIEENHGRGIVAVASGPGLIEGNIIRSNGLVGVDLREQAREFEISSNRFIANAARNSGKAVRAMPGSTRTAVRVSPDTQSIRITGNRYE